jgi:hypothetical protein
MEKNGLLSALEASKADIVGENNDKSKQSNSSPAYHLTVRGLYLNDLPLTGNTGLPGGSRSSL